MTYAWFSHLCLQYCWSIKWYLCEILASSFGLILEISLCHNLLFTLLPGLAMTLKLLADDDLGLVILFLGLNLLRCVFLTSLLTVSCCLGLISSFFEWLSNSDLNRRFARRRDSISDFKSAFSSSSRFNWIDSWKCRLKTFSFFIFTHFLFFREVCLSR